MTLSGFTFGGCYGIVTLMKKTFVDEYGWVNEDEMLDLVGGGLSKSAIQAALDYNGYMLLMIASLAELPIANQQIDVVLPIFSPSNYAEFERILKPGGELVSILHRTLPKRLEM